MARSSRKRVDEAPKEEEADAQPKAKAVQAIFAPIGIVNVHLVSPNGNEYHIKPREEFKIAAEDVDWFFGDWEWCFRQRLVRAEDYNPTCGYHDPKGGQEDYSPESAYHDPKAGQKDYSPESKYHDPKAGQKDYSPALEYDPAPTPEAKPIDAHGARATETEVNSGEKE